MLQRLFVSVFLCVASLSVIAQEVVKVELSKAGSGGSADVRITKPTNLSGKNPALVVLHHAGGYSAGTTEQYAKHFASKGYIVAEPLMFATASQRLSGEKAQEISFATLSYLASLEEVDPNKVGVMGLSYGAVLSLFSSTKGVTRKYTSSNQFAAHATLYGLCWYARKHLEGAERVVSQSGFPKEIWEEPTGAPVLMLVGGKDNYEPSNTCEKFIEKAPVKDHYSVIIYPEATHGWDHEGSREFFDRMACEGNGCLNRNESNPEVTAKGMKDLETFFDKNLK
jgi:dienelactone hydrolase